MSAYTILDRLRPQGFRAPLQVYRALDRLIELGLVHRLASMHSFIACSHPLAIHPLVAFAICKECGNITEFNDNAVVYNIKKRMKRIRFSLQGTILETRGICAKCQCSTQIYPKNQCLG